MTRPMLLVLHGVRLTGFADTPVVARRFGIATGQADELLRDAQTQGWVEYSTFAGTSGWSLTESGRQQNEHLLATEVAGAADAVRAVYKDFLPLNALLQRACTDWQLRPTPTDPLAANDHSDPEWDAGVLHELSVIERALGSLTARLAGILPRFGGYDTRFAAALSHATAGETAWVDRSDVDSCHRVWFELHEDLIATLNLQRGD